MDALKLALAYYREPMRNLGRIEGRIELPQGMDALLRVAGGESALVETAMRITGASAEEAGEAAAFFIQQVCFAKDADHYRVMGLNPEAGSNRVKEHHRLLMRLFHPDRQGVRGTWTEVYAGRVNEAYNILRKGESRRAYDVSLKAAPVQARRPAEVPVAGARRRHGVATRPRAGFVALPPVRMRNLPQAVLGGLAVLAALCVGGVYLSRAPASGGEVAAQGAAGWGDIVAAAETAEPIHYLGPVVEAQAPPERPPISETTWAVPPSSLSPAPNFARRNRERSEGAETAAASRAAPPDPAAASQPAEAATTGISMLELESLLANLVGRYERGDLEGFMALFSDRAVSGDQVGKVAIRGDYEHLFRSSEARRMGLSDLHWRLSGERGRGDGRFLVRVQGRGEPGFTHHWGRIRFEVQKRDGKVRIGRMDYAIEKTYTYADLPDFPVAMERRYR